MEAKALWFLLPKLEETIFVQWNYWVNLMFLEFCQPWNCVHQYLFYYPDENKLTNLKGIENLKFLMAFRFDSNEIDSLEYFANNTSMRYISANCNKISSLKGLEKLTELRSLSICNTNIIVRWKSAYFFVATEKSSTFRLIISES